MLIPSGMSNRKPHFLAIAKVVGVCHMRLFQKAATLMSSIAGMCKNGITKTAK